MPAFVSPLASASDWTFEAEDVRVPDGFRYGDYRLTGLRARSSTGSPVVLPAQGAWRSDDRAGQRWYELQPTPFPIRTVVSRLAMGVPVFYFVFEGTTTPGIARDTSAQQSLSIASVTTVLIAVAGQDRIRRDPALWASDILEALRGGGTSTAWEPFAIAVSAAFARPGEEPCVLYSHTGDVMDVASVELAAPDGTVVEVRVESGDRGDVVAAARRLGLANPWTLRRPLSLSRINRSSSQQFAALEDGATGATSIEISSRRRHLSFIDLDDWFADQFAAPAAGTERLARFHRGNRVRFHQGGKRFFDEWFRLLGSADVHGGGVHLTGWAMFNEFLAERRPPDPLTLPCTLEQVMQRLHRDGGSGRFLPTHFFQLESDSAMIPAALLLASGLGFLALTLGRSGFNDAGLVSFATGIVAAATAAGYLLGSSLRDFEPNRYTYRDLNAIEPHCCAYSPHPAIVADNPLGVAALAASETVPHWMLDGVLSLVTHLSVSHQKFSVIRLGPASAPKHYGYYGGIDFVAQQLDDIHHNLAAPFHDVQARVEGPAVRDLALTFEHRWMRDGESDPGQPRRLAFPTPTTATLVAERFDPGPNCVMQVARTYFSPAGAPPDPRRTFAFAPNGDRTIFDTLIRGIGMAREFIYLADQYLTPPPAYEHALFNALSNIKQLIIAVPGQTDVPFGDIARSGFIARLRAAAERVRTPVRVGYPRRRITLRDTTLAASGGRLRLAEPLPGTEPRGPQQTIRVRPASRVPPPPFWILCEGELMRVRAETRATGAPSDIRALDVDRGAATGLVSPPASRGSGDGPPPDEPSIRAHNVGAPVTVVDLTGIYVHCKMLIVDDIFLSHGSANTNRRGFFSDNELNVFTVPEALRMSPDNPVAALRRQVWAELLDLPPEVGTPLLDDPVDCLTYFDRSPLLGNRYVDIDWRPEKLTWSVDLGESGVADALNTLAVTILGELGSQIDVIAGDPSNRIEPPPL
jgi:phosphatidylserine/phosphatidylglycerophosphate/cardiolipin synthase-like enzyme